MGVQNYLTDYNALKAFPMDLGRLLSIYGITTQKAMLSKFTIKEKILPVMSSKADPQLSIPTLYYTIDAVIRVKTDSIVGVYVPDVDKDTLLELFQTALAHFSAGTAPEVIRDLIAHIERAMESVRVSSNSQLFDFDEKCFGALEEVRKYLDENQSVAVGYALAARKEGSPITIGNAVMCSLSEGLDIDEIDDLSKIVFTDPFNDLATSDLTMGLIDKIAATAGKAISAIQSSDGIIEGAQVLVNDISESTADYLIEVRCAASNVRSMVSLCEKTNCDMECDLFKDTTTSEDCVADIPKGRLGWGDPSIIAGDQNTIKMNTDDIFSMSQITGKNIQYVLGAIITSDDEGERKVLTEKLKNSIVETMKWEGAHENFMDLPVAHFVDTSVIMLETLVKNTKYASRLEEAHSSILEGIRVAMEEGNCTVPGVFNPCPTLNAVTPFPVSVRSSQLAFNKIWRAATDEEMDEAMLEFAKLYSVEKNVFCRESVMEDADIMESNAVTKGARDLSRKVQKGSEKVIRDVGGTAHELKQAAHNAIDPMEKYIGQMMERLKKEDANKRREIIVKGGVAPKVLRWIKRSIPLIAGAAIGAHVVPAAAVASGIALVGFIASDKYLDAKEKRKILREIEDELEIVNEKIDDARGDSNKQKRYELIRIRNNLKRTQDRIVYNLKE